MSAYVYSIAADKNNIIFGNSTIYLHEESYQLYANLNKYTTGKYGGVEYVPYSDVEFSNVVTSLGNDKHSPYHGRTVASNYPPLAVSVDTRYSFSTSTKEFFAAHKKINSPDNTDSIYPIAVRYVSKNGTYFIERPPFKMNVSFSGGKRPINTSIWMPWSIFVLDPKRYLNSKLLFSNTPLSSMSDKYLPAYTPNIYADGRICLSASLNGMPKEAEEDIRHLYGYIYNEYMNGGWNNDLYPNVSNIISCAAEIFADEERYPTLCKLLRVTAEDIWEHNKHIRKPTAERYVLDHKHNYIHRYDLFKCFFLCLSTFSLEEVLSFYKESIAFCTAKNSDVFQFDQIVNTSEIEYQYGYSSIPNHISSYYATNGFQLNYENSVAMKSGFIIVKNYQHNSGLLSLINRGSYSAPDSIMRYIPSDIIADFFALTRNTQNHHVLVYEYDFLDNSRSYSTLEKKTSTFELRTSLRNHYNNMIIDQYSVPVVTSDMEVFENAH
jgi:hypothetical protein